MKKNFSFVLSCLLAGSFLVMSCKKENLTEAQNKSSAKDSKTAKGQGLRALTNGAVIGVAMMKDGTMLGLGTDKQLYTQISLNGPWWPHPM